MSTSYTEYAPDAALAPFVECLWTVVAREATPDHLVLPDGCLDIVYSSEIGLQAVGTMTAAQKFALPARTEIVGIRFRPGQAGRFLRVAAPQLTDRSAALEELWGAAGRELEGRLEETAQPRDRALLLARSLPVPEDEPAPVQRAIAALVSAGGNADLEAIARQANLSERQFRRRCQEESGLAPKHLCRVLRFRSALRGLDLGAHRGWAHLAALSGYYDQAHFIHEFREFCGYTPAEYAGRA